MLVMPIARLLICANKNNGDKFSSRKSMRAVDEKLIINELEKCCYLSCMNAQLNCMEMLLSNFL